MVDKSMNRRSFMKTTAGAAALGISGCAAGSKSWSSASSARRTVGANERISVGVVGYGGQGRRLAIYTMNLADPKKSNVQVAAVCDLWRHTREKAVAEMAEKMSSKPQAFIRHRDMLDKVDLDAVIIATPDFWHVPVLLDCVKAGKDVYVEKPLCVTLNEAKAARDAVHAAGSVVQVGTQRRSEDSMYAARDFVRSGKLGTISTIEGAFNDCSPRWRNESLCKRIKESDFDWKYYLGNRKYRPFDPHRVIEWKLYRDFTMGTCGLLGCHMLDAVHFIMDASYPISAVSQGGVFVYKDGREVEDTIMSLLEYPQEFIHHYTTRLGNASGTGIRIRGTQGTLEAEKGFYSGEGSKKEDRLPDKPVKLTLPKQRRPSHMKNFYDCMRSRKAPVASIDIGYQHMIASVIAQQAMHENRKLYYDPKKDRIV